MITPPITIPRTITKGDSVSFDVGGTGYSPSLFTLKFVIQSPVPKILEAVAAGDRHVVTATPEQTSALDHGRFPFSLIWTTISDSARTTDGMGQILVLPDPTAAIGMSWARQALTNIEGAITKLTLGTNKSVDIDGQVYTKRDLKELFEARDRLIVTVSAELAEIGHPNKSGFKTIYTRFRS